MREANVVSRREELPDSFTDTELLETLAKVITKGWVLNSGHGVFNIIGPGSTKTGRTIRDLMNPIHKERVEQFL